MASLVRRSNLAQFLPNHEAVREWEGMRSDITRLSSASPGAVPGGLPGQVLTKGSSGGYSWTAPSGGSPQPWNFDMGTASGPAAGGFDLGSAA